jgi:hypothetical protein
MTNMMTNVMINVMTNVMTIKTLKHCCFIEAGLLVFIPTDYSRLTK